MDLLNKVGNVVMGTKRVSNAAEKSTSVRLSDSLRKSNEPFDRPSALQRMQSIGEEMPGRFSQGVALDTMGRQM